MVSFRDAAASSIRSGLCAVLAVNDDGQRLLVDILGPFPGNEYFNVAGALRSQICNIDPEEQEELEPPFTGGQCNAVYSVFATTSGVDLSIGGQSPRNLQGPLGGVTLVTTLIGSPFPDSTRYQFVFSGPNDGPEFTARADFTPAPGFRIAGRVDALPDDCGDPPPIIPPPGPVERPITVIYDTDDSTEITVNGTIVFAPVFVEFDGTLRMPINLDLGGFEWSGNIELAPEFNIELFPRGIDETPGITDGDEEPFPEDPSDPIEPVEEDAAPTIIGVEVFSQVSASAPASSILFPGGPNIYAPRLGSVKFAIRTPTSLVWTADIDIKNRESYIPNPVTQGAVAVRVSPAPGVAVRFNVIRDRPLPVPE